jgi:arsenate reductase
MAEALLKKYAGDAIEVQSAGTRPKGLHPLTVRVMNEIGVDMSAHYSKHLDEFLQRHTPSHVVFVCDAAADESCPRIWPFALQTESWSLDDPAAVDGSPDEKLEAFREIRQQIDERVRHWIRLHQHVLSNS